MVMLRQDVVQGAPLAERHPDRPVAAARAGAGGHQVPHPGQTGEGHPVPAQPDAEPAHLRQAPGDEGGPGVVAEAQAVGDPGRHRQHVLQCPGQLAAPHVHAGVHPEGRGHQRPLHPGGGGLVGQRHHGGRRLAGHHLGGQVGAGEDPGRRGRGAPRPTPRSSAAGSPARAPWSGSPPACRAAGRRPSRRPPPGSRGTAPPSAPGWRRPPPRPGRRWTARPSGSRWSGR